jgi:hypothetical protein
MRVDLKVKKAVNASLAGAGSTRAVAETDVSSLFLSLSQGL